MLSRCQRHWIPGFNGLKNEYGKNRWTLAMRDRGFSSETRLVGALADVFPCSPMNAIPLRMILRSATAQVPHHPDHHKRQRRRPQIDQGPLLEAGDVGPEQQAIGGVASGAEGQGQG